MKTAIVYVSKHHGNTKKLVDAIASVTDVTIIDGSEEINVDLNVYDCIGFASGIAFRNFYPEIFSIIENHLPKNKKVFFLYTCGTKYDIYTHLVKKRTLEKDCTILGAYGCLGYDTFGPFKLIGGISKGHPNEKEISEAVQFFMNIGGK